MANPSRKILLIEDDPHTNQLITDNLRMKGHEVISAFSGEEGLEAARKHFPELVLLDIILPGMDGWDVCRAMRTVGSGLEGIPIIIITVLSQDESRSRGMGVIHFISKPFDIRGIVAEIEAALGRVASGDAAG